MGKGIVQMRYRDTSDERECKRDISRNEKATGKLLDLLIYHHDQNMKRPAVVVEVKPPRLVYTAPPKPSREFRELWFGLVEEEDFEKPPLKIEDIKRVVGAYFNLTNVQLVSQRREIDTTRPRQIAAYLAHKLTGRSSPEIGRRLGDRDHSTILSSCRRIAALRMTDWKVAYDVAFIEEKLDEIHASASGRFADETTAAASPDRASQGFGSVREALQRPAE